MLPNVRTLVENGLSEEAALAALTTNPARILGMSATMGTIEEGKMGNLVVATGSIFDKETKIRYVFVDGRKFELEAEKEDGKGSDSAAAAVAGTWSFTAATPDGDVRGSLRINDDLTGTITLDIADEEMDITSVKLEDDVLSFSFDLDNFDIVSVSVTVSGDEFDGEATSDAGSATISGKRLTDPKL